MVIDFDMVIKGLKCCIKKRYSDPCPTECPYYKYRCNDGKHCRKMHLDLLPLTVIQGARPAFLYKAEQIKMFPKDSEDSFPVVIEEKIPYDEWNGGSTVKWVGADFALEMFLDTFEKHSYEWYVFGKTFRMWSCMPSKNQREEMPWDD